MAMHTNETDATTASSYPSSLDKAVSPSALSALGVLADASRGAAALHVTAMRGVMPLAQRWLKTLPRERAGLPVDLDWLYRTGPLLVDGETIERYATVLQKAKITRAGAIIRRKGDITLLCSLRNPNGHVLRLWAKSRQTPLFGIGESEYWGWAKEIQGMISPGSGEAARGDNTIITLLARLGRSGGTIGRGDLPGLDYPDEDEAARAWVDAAAAAGLSRDWLDAIADHGAHTAQVLGQALLADEIGHPWTIAPPPAIDAVPVFQYGPAGRVTDDAGYIFTTQADLDAMEASAAGGATGAGETKDAGNPGSTEDAGQNTTPESRPGVSTQPEAATPEIRADHTGRVTGIGSAASDSTPDAITGADGDDTLGGGSAGDGSAGDGSAGDGSLGATGQTTVSAPPPALRLKGSVGPSGDNLAGDVALVRLVLSTTSRGSVGSAGSYPATWDRLPGNGKLYQAPVETTGAGNPLAGSDQALLLAITLLLHETVPYPDAATRDTTHAQLAIGGPGDPSRATLTDSPAWWAALEAWTFADKANLRRVDDTGTLYLAHPVMSAGGVGASGAANLEGLLLSPAAAQALAHAAEALQTARGLSLITLPWTSAAEIYTAPDAGTDTTGDATGDATPSPSGDTNIDGETTRRRHLRLGTVLRRLYPDLSVRDAAPDLSDLADDARAIVEGWRADALTTAGLLPAPDHGPLAVRLPNPEDGRDTVLDRDARGEALLPPGVVADAIWIGVRLSLSSVLFGIANAVLPAVRNRLIRALATAPSGLTDDPAARSAWARSNDLTGIDDCELQAILKHFEAERATINQRTPGRAAGRIDDAIAKARTAFPAAFERMAQPIETSDLWLYAKELKAAAETDKTALEARFGGSLPGLVAFWIEIGGNLATDGTSIAASIVAVVLPPAALPAAAIKVATTGVEAIGAYGEEADWLAAAVSILVDTRQDVAGGARRLYRHLRTAEDAAGEAVAKAARRPGALPADTKPTTDAITRGLHTGLEELWNEVVGYFLKEWIGGTVQNRGE